ncbi:hypothetical protein C6502_15875 [Candidatus Poribacteria bacterium]|nr:MAG: hypothetical protein C6502_15875 [Candidatus Poribacteria bacterium]
MNEKRQPHLLTGLIVFFVGCFVVSSHAAVTSIGEINVKDDDQGLVPAGSTVTLIVTLRIDRSLAKPVDEDIRTIEIILPAGFIVEPSNFKSFSRDGQQTGAVLEPVGSRLHIRLDKPITDLENTLNEIVFDGIAPNPTLAEDTTAEEVTFRARLRNLEDVPIGGFIQPGNTDGKLNNDDFTLQIIPNVPPAPVERFSGTRDANGENDVTLIWRKSDNPDVAGYFIYRNDAPRIDIKVELDSSRNTEVFLDVNVAPGTHDYAIEAYKTPLLRSERSDTVTVEVLPDTAPPQPPQNLTVVESDDVINVSWIASPTPDVVKYRLFFGQQGKQLTRLINQDGSIVEIAAEGSNAFLDERRLGVGAFTYAIEAMDEVGNRSEQVSQVLRILGKPFPNPFTPLSNNPDFNRVVFPARAIEGVEGEFSVLIFNINGVLIRELKSADPGARDLEWDGKDEVGDLVESGVYVYQIQVGESFDTGTVIVAK